MNNLQNINKQKELKMNNFTTQMAFLGIIIVTFFILSCTTKDDSLARGLSVAAVVIFSLLATYKAGRYKQNMRKLSEQLVQQTA